MIEAAVLFCLLAAQHEAGPAATGPESGTNLFRRNCSSCHGKGGEGGRAPSLTGSLRIGDSDADMIRVIAGGIPGTEMPSYEARLGRPKIERKCCNTPQAMPWRHGKAVEGLVQAE